MCGEPGESVEHLLAEFKTFTSNDYLARNIRALLLKAVTRAKEYNLVEEDVI